MTAKEVENRYDEYATLIQHLKAVVQASNERTIQEVPDALFIDNLNFFVKAYLVSLCTYLEAFLQDLAFLHLSAVKNRLALARIPHNVVCWELLKELKDKDMRYEDFGLATTRKDLADQLSGNPGKTINLFRLVGIDLQASQDFKAHKDLIGTIVQKRNNIIHHNDSAADVSMSDILAYADHFLKYMKSVADCVGGVAA